MKLNRSSNKQPSFPFRVESGLPFAVSPRSLDRSALREFRMLPDAVMPDRQFLLLRYAEKVALLHQLRRIYKQAMKRNGGAAVYAGTPEGRRAHKQMDQLMLEIAAERTSLCG